MPGVQTPYGVSTDRSEKWRDQRGVAITAARSLLDTVTGPTLSAEDQARYDGLMKEARDLDDAIKRDESLAVEESRTGESLSPPTKPTPRTDTAVTPAKRTATPEYERSFDRYLLTGDARGLAMSEHRATADGLQADSDTAGGFAVAPQRFVNTLIQAVDDAVLIRGLATVQRVSDAASLGIPSLDADPEDGDWTQELTNIDLDTQMEFGKRELRPHELTKGIKVSRKLVARSTLGIEALVTRRLAYKMAITEEKAFMTGNGVNRPLGVFTASADGISTGRDVAATSTTAIDADAVIKTKYQLKPQYRASAACRWIFHRDVLEAVALLKDGNGQYLWQPGLATSVPDRVLGIPFLESEYAPNTFTTGLYMAILGDFSNYWIADAEDVSVQRLVELYALSNQYGFFIRAATDGMPVLEEAFARLKLA